MSSRLNVKGRAYGPCALTFAARFFESIDSACSLKAHMLLRAGDFESIARLSVDPRNYTDPSAFMLDYACTKLLAKYPRLPTGIDTRAKARETFEACEIKCQESNARWRRRENGELFPVSVERVISRAQQKISSILGDVPSLESLNFAFGPGAAYGVRKETSVYNKVVADLECTYGMVSGLSEFLAEFPGWVPPGTHSVRLIPGSQLSFVPKDAKTDRPICIEPLLNGLYQKGVGSYIRKRLKMSGVNLDDQTINQRLASVCHIDDLATVDFSSASDTISYGTVLNLLPIDWFEFLDVARSPSYQDGNVWKTFQKFSSMGNAYTFELESLIFFAVAFATIEESGIRPSGHNLSVYGDDVIIPRQAFDLFSEVCEAIGFAINKDKTFTEGPFFESCGHDYFQGYNVRPFLLKKRIEEIPSIYYVLNSLKRFIAKIPNQRHLAIEALWRLYDDVLWSVPKQYRFMGPDGYGDGHIVADLDAAIISRSSRVTRHRHYDGWWFLSVQEAPVVRSLPEYPMAYALYNTVVSGALRDLRQIPRPLDNGRGYPLRGKTRLGVRRIFCHSEWHDVPGSER